MYYTRKLFGGKDYGVYVGSANLTQRAWKSNIEFGIFIKEDVLESNNTLGEIEGFFDALMNCENSHTLTEEIVKDQEKLQERRSRQKYKLDNDSRAKRLIPIWNGPAEVLDRRSAYSERKARFVREWQSSLTELRNIARIAPSYRPHWLENDVPASWQADQFLHAYYYNRVVKGNKHPYESFHSKNSENPAEAMKQALIWWSKLEEPPSGEDVNCHSRAPVIRQLLAPERLKTMTEQEFQRVCKANHSTTDHVMRTGAERFGVAGESVIV